MPGFVHVPFNDLEAIKSAIGPQTAAVMLEPIQGEGGIIPADPGYLKAVRAFCDEKGILLLFDEVQCGMGRTGYLFAWQGYGVEPDAFSLAKALGNGFPIGAFLVRRSLVDVLGPGTHASTFGGNPLGCAAACAVLDTIHKEHVLANCVKQGHYLKEKLQSLAARHPCVKGVRGRGLMIGLLLDRPASSLLPLLRAQGLIALSAGEKVLRLLPPLIVTAGQVDEAVGMIDRALTKLPPLAD